MSYRDIEEMEERIYEVVQEFIDMTEGWHATCTARHHYLTNPKGAACSQWQHK